ncbi:hypothetical protein BJV82DRAFT_33762 [Fennellomyces sp. T-0311]|nr:hypothetical protein BJV82DRAFT_33762 [Fennellomyces sp. T-0311]
MQQLLRRIDGRIETLQTLTQDAKVIIIIIIIIYTYKAVRCPTQQIQQFMEENREAIDALAFDEEGDNNSPWPSPANSSRQTSAKSIHSIKEAAALEEKHPTTKKRSATLSSASSRRYSSSIHRVPSLLLDPHLPYDSINPFDYRQEEVRLGVCALENEMGDFKRDLQITEELIRDIQIDINDTRLRMSSYIKDIPETHYSAVSVLLFHIVLAPLSRISAQEIGSGCRVHSCQPRQEPLAGYRLCVAFISPNM